MQCLIHYRQHLSADIPEDIKLLGESRVVCGETTTDESSTGVTTEGRSLTSTAGTKVEFDETTDAIARKTKLCVGRVTVKKAAGSDNDCESSPDSVDGTND